MPVKNSIIECASNTHSVTEMLRGKLSDKNPE
jgi:hypothetical protein